MLSATLALIMLSPIRVQAATPQDPQKPEWPATPRTLVSEDYKNWERLGRTDLSGDGKWISSSVSLVDGDPSVILKSAATGTVEKFFTGFGFSFSDDSQWYAVTTRPTREESDKLREAKKPIPTTLQYWRLGTDQRTKVENIGTFQFLKGSKFLVITRRPAVVTPGVSGDLDLVDLKTGSIERYLNVESFSSNDAGTALTLTVKSSTGDTGLRVLDLESMKTKTLYWGSGDLAAVRWAQEGNALALLTGESNDKKEGNSYSVSYYADALSGSSPVVLKSEGVTGMPAEWRISDRTGLSFSRDGKAIFVGTQEWKDKKKPAPPEKEKPGVEVWNTADKTPVPQQKLQMGQFQMQAINYAWFPSESRVVKLNESLDQMVRARNSNYSLVMDSEKYASAKTDGVDYADLWAINMQTGERWAVFTNQAEASISIGNTGRYLAHYRAKHWWLVDLESRQSTKLIGKGVDFENSLDDRPAKIKSPGGFVNWLRDDEAFVVHDEFDAWLAKPGDGNLSRLTNFRGQNVSARYRSIENLDGKAPRLSDPMYFSLVNEATKGTGLYLSDGTGVGKTLLMSDKRIAGVQKAKNSDQVIYMRQSWEESPVVVMTDPTFSKEQVLLTTNDQQRYFKWGSASVIQYKSRWGAPLQGALITPADYDPSKKYPMVLYIYERESGMVNGYQPPADTNAYNLQVLSQSGYFVLVADIAYRTNDPGVSAVDCLEPAVDAAIKANKSIDSSKVGLIGHSWGAYQTAFVTTVSKKFAVGACGAPLTEMTSMYNSFYWNAGITNQVIFEQSQGRFDAPFWEIPEKYIENSPVWRSRERTAPILVAFGDKDGAVDWSQGQFLYNTLRRLGKKSVMLLYAGENHGLVQPGNQKDYAKRLRHYLDVYLKGAKAEDWVEKGVSYPDQQGG